MIDIENTNCFNAMKHIKDNSIDFILTDPPYGRTVAKWDINININELWKQYKRVIKPTGVIAIFGIEPFSTMVKASNIMQFKYDWIWIKDKATNHLNCKKQPMRKNELISIFYKKWGIYNPQFKKKDPKNIRSPKKKMYKTTIYNNHYKLVDRSIPFDMSYPDNILYFNGCSGKKGNLHPSQKPIPLLEYLIKTYTKENDIILDSFMGIGSTGIAANNLKRSFIGFEIDRYFFQIAKDKIFSYNQVEVII